MDRFDFDNTSPMNACVAILESGIARFEIMVGPHGYLDPDTQDLDAEELEESRKIQQQLADYTDFLEKVKRIKSIVTKLQAKSAEPIKNFRHKGRDFTVLKEGSDFIFQMDGKTFDNDGSGWSNLNEAMDAIRNYVRDNKKAFSQEVQMDLNNYPTLSKILAEVNPTELKKLKQTIQDMINRHYPLHDIGLVDTGEDVFEIHVGDMVADPRTTADFEDKLNSLFWEMKTKKTYPSIEPNWWGDRKEEGIYLIGLGAELDESERMMSVTEFPWAGTGHEDYIQDLANLLLVDAVAMILEDTDSELEILPKEKLKEWRDSVIYPGAELTETIPDFFTQEDFGYHRYLPTGTIKELEAKVNKALDGKVTLKEIHEENDHWASGIVMQCMGHGVSAQDDPAFIPWIEQFGVTEDNLDQFPHIESAYESAWSMLEDFYKFEQSDFDPNMSLSNTHTEQVQVFDNGGKTLDRYTVLIHNPDGSIDVYGMSQNPYDSYGFNQYNFTAESIDQINLGGDVEVRVEELPEAVRKAIQERMADEAPVEAAGGTEVVEEIPKDWPVQPLKPGQEAKDPATCGHCHLTWDDAVPTSMTPTPSGRCPFESFHIHDDESVEAAE